MLMAGIKTSRRGRRGHLRSPIRNEVEPSAKKICAQCSTLWLSGQYLRSIIQPNYHLTDGFKEYTTALLTHYGQWVPPPRRQAKGPTPKPRWMPVPQLLYAQVVKTVRRRRLVRVSHRVVFGTLEAVKQVLAACGWQIQTAFFERLTLDIRQRVAAVGRRVTTLCKGEDGVRQQLVVFQTYHNFCLPHASLRQPLAAPLPTNGM